MSPSIWDFEFDDSSWGEIPDNEFFSGWYIDREWGAHQPTLLSPDKDWNPSIWHHEHDDFSLVGSEHKFYWFVNHATVSEDDDLWGENSETYLTPDFHVSYRCGMFMASSGDDLPRHHDPDNPFTVKPKHYDPDNPVVLIHRHHDPDNPLCHDGAHQLSRYSRILGIG